MKNKVLIGIKMAFIFVIALLFLVFIGSLDTLNKEAGYIKMKILVSEDNKDMESILKEYAYKNNVNLIIDYASDHEIIKMVNSKQDEYNAVFLSDSLWLNMLDNKELVTDVEKIYTSPIVFGINNKVALNLGLTNKENITLQEIIEIIKGNNLKIASLLPTQTTTGAVSYFGFISNFLSVPKDINQDILKDETLKNNLSSIYQSFFRTVLTEQELKNLYQNEKCDIIIAKESLVININQNINNEENLMYAVYTDNGIANTNGIFGYIDTKNPNMKNAFLKMQRYLMSEEVQKRLLDFGKRPLYYDYKQNINEKIFNITWGINIDKKVNDVTYPNINVIDSAFDLYQESLKRKTHTVYLIDYSDNFNTERKNSLISAMEYILDKDKAKQDYIQYSASDKITVIPFNAYIGKEYSTDNGENTKSIIDGMKQTTSADITDSIIRAFNILKNEDSSYDLSIVIITYGEIDKYDEELVEQEYINTGKDIPIYSIIMGNASEKQANKLAIFTLGKVFNGKDEEILNVLKEFRKYN